MTAARRGGRFLRNTAAEADALAVERVKPSDGCHEKSIIRELSAIVG
jgi:hypothetical protein